MRGTSAASSTGAARHADLIEAACRRIAPSWPLDQFIAVNPWWGRIDQRIERATAEIAALSGARTTVDRTLLRAAWHDATLGRAHIEAAVDRSGGPCTADALIARLQADEPALARLPLLADLRDARRDLRHALPWTDVITHQVSQHCASFFDEQQASWAPSRRAGLYGSWRQRIARDHGIRLLMGDARVARRARALPADAPEAIDHVLADLALPSTAIEGYLSAALLSVLGWASWCAYRRWQARLAGADDEHIVELLAIRLAWDWLLDDGRRGPGTIHAGLLAAWQGNAAYLERLEREHQQDWLLQLALELSYQSSLRAALARVPHRLPSTPRIQAVFCIDVRSEVMRRALEACDGSISTHGFAGFFGLPIAYTPLGTRARRPQLPGLLAPTMEVTDQAGDEATRARIAAQRGDALDARSRWSAFRTGASSTFTFVESLGWTYAAQLLARSLAQRGRGRTTDRFGLGERDARSLRPRLEIAACGDAAARAGAELAERVLGAMGMGAGLARLVLLVGHGSQSANNPHAAGLDCGACCGQTGEVNSRALAALLNDPEVRHLLAGRGLSIPSETWFVPGQHNTTTDDVELFDTDLAPPTHTADLHELRKTLTAAGARARAERAPRLGLGHLADRPQALERAVRERANDWSQVRPEWALADCAAFVVAPRDRTRGIDLAGRAFLHDYDWTRDPTNGVLELIMTAPMVVTHWISMQYYASTVDNRRYGSGNKVLHNVVGGRIGVFEGNGGDLRIGLPWQSVHDGHRFVHTPLRLSVFIEAPRERIDAVIAAHSVVRRLLDNGWLHLLRIEPRGTEIERYTPAGWSQY